MHKTLITYPASRVFLASFALAILSPGTAQAESNNPLAPFEGVSNPGTDTTTLEGKIMTGYQGWFNCKGDGAGIGWIHWARNPRKHFAPGNVTVDLWPDMSEATPSEQYPTGFKHKNGEPAVVFSSRNRLTVLRHFKWMREYGMDGAFVQRFAASLRNRKLRHNRNVVLSHCREGANLEGRSYVVMYDLSGLQAGQMQQVAEDWKTLREKMRMGSDPAYQHHEGKPLVAIWGIGFNDGRKYTLEECRSLIEFFKADGCAVMLGVPTGWRELHRDAVREKALHEVIELVDIISPWTVGRYRNLNLIKNHAKKYHVPDIMWCEQREMDYLPVVFPGFSWHNLKPDSPPDTIPRLGGQFLWTQLVEAKKAGANMVYVAMFDEVDEGTAIFKCTNNPPVGPNPFLTYEDLPSDHYLWLTGEGGRLLRGERPLQEKVPARGRSR